MLSDTVFTPVPASERDTCAYIQRRQHTFNRSQGEFLYFPQYIGHYVAHETFAVQRQGYCSILALFTLSGEGVLEDNRVVSLLPGTLMLLDCEAPHRYRAVREGWEFKYIHFTGSASREFAVYINKRFGSVHRMDYTAYREAIQLVDRIAEETEKRGPDAPARLSALLYRMMMCLTADAGAPEGGVNSDSTSAILSAADYMDRHYAEPIETTELATRVYMTRAYFSTLFKRVCGVTPHEYLTARRMDAARKLLTESTYSISEIACTVGFSDASAFTRAFIRESHLTPTQYRHITPKEREKN